MAIAGLILWQTQAAGDPVLHRRECRFGTDTAVAIEHLVRHAILFQYRDVAGGAIELGLGTEQLQRAAAALIILDRLLHA
jgi:hypothetical protein